MLPSGVSGEAAEPDKWAEVAATCACMHVRKAARAVTRIYDGYLRPSGLRATQFNVLIPLARNDAMPVTRLSRILGMDRSTLTRHITRLRRSGLVSVRVGSDRRSQLVSLTDQGREVLTIALPLWDRAQAHILASIGDADWSSVLPVLRQLSRQASS
jgi:DNA-binding MarR family transcriptional regulator